MPTVINWPMARLAPKDLNWWPGGMIDTGGKSLSGLEQSERLDGGPLWRCTMAQIPLSSRAEILAFQALQMLLAGGTQPIVIPREPSFRAPVVTTGGGVPHSDDTPFADSSLYSAPSIMAALTADHELRAYQLAFSYAGGLALEGGEDFSIEHPAVGWRMYRVTKVTLVELQSGGDYLYEIEIGPPLRDDVPAGTVLDFDTPRCTMKLTDPESFATALTANRYGFVDATFDEAFW